MQWAIEGAPIHSASSVPGRLYASAPFYDNRQDVDHAAEFLNRKRPDLPPVRILVRDSDAPGTPWRRDA